MEEVSELIISLLLSTGFNSFLVKLNKRLKSFISIHLSMNLGYNKVKNLVINSLTSFKEYLINHKYSVIAQFLVFLLSTILAAEIKLARELLTIGGQKNDYAIFYYVSPMLFDGRIKYIYDWDYIYYNVSEIMQFRYLPSSLLFFYPLSFMNLVPSYYLFNTLSFMLTLVSMYFCEKIIMEKSDDSSTLFRRRIFFVFFMAIFHISNYICGQPTSLVLFFMMGSLYAFIKGKEVVGCLLISVSIMIKPLTYFIIIFLILSMGGIKEKIKRIIWMVIPLVLDIALFLSVDGLLEGFLARNFGPTIHPEYGEFPGPNLMSFSLNTLISILFGVPGSYLFIASVAVWVILGWWILSRIKDKDKKIIFCFIFGIIGFFLCQSFLWAINLIIIYPLLIILSYYIDKKKRKEYLFIMIIWGITTHLIMHRVNIVMLYVSWVLFLLNVMINFYFIWYAFKATRVPVEARVNSP
ncbi:MAG: glycosyltransferase family 87 protein [Candidatus Hodarchaeota archaeon]